VSIETYDRPEDFEVKMRRGGDAAMREMCRFFMRDDPVHRSLERIASKLEELTIPYAVVGGMALNAHGFTRATTDVDVLVTPEGLKAVHDALEGLGYVPPFTGSKQLRDTQTGVRIEFLVTGNYPGSGKPQPVAFPDPKDVGVVIGGIRYLKLPVLLELKLASGMYPGRLKDLGDVQELIRILDLPQNYGDQLNEYVRAKYIEMWEAVKNYPTPES
jgi:hypothetical protein